MSTRLYNRLADRLSERTYCTPIDVYISLFDLTTIEIQITNPPYYDNRRNDSGFS